VPEIADEAELQPAERSYIAMAVRKRRAEFATARKCARRALTRLGVNPSASLVPYADRSPRWPNGVVGSISHTDGCCVVVVGRAGPALAIGVDVEPEEPLPHELYSMVCTSDELEWLNGHSDDMRGVLARVLFSAKEAVYKCQYPSTRRMMEFTEIGLELDVDAGRFVVSSRPTGMTVPLCRVIGVVVKSSGFIFCAARLEGPEVLLPPSSSSDGSE
jgi:4'-phosphopantetheinyl transferase EntD